MIRNTVLSVLFCTLFTASISFGAVNEIKNEYWSWDSGTAKDLIFENYFFSDDDTFRYSWGSSGEKYSGGWYSGTYFYDKEKSKIVFNVTANDTMGSSEKIERLAPKELKINEIGNDSVKIDLKAAHYDKIHKLFDGTMKRYRGRISEQTWRFIDYMNISEFSFDPQGNCFFRTGKRGADFDLQYECEYNITGDIIFLQIKSAFTKTVNTENGSSIKYDPAVKTYIRFAKSADGEMYVEKIKFANILDNSRGWEYSGGEYKVYNQLPPLKQKDFNTYAIEKQNSGTVTSLSEPTEGEITIY